MRHLASSNSFMDWQKYPKSRTPISIRQPETLDSIKCHTFPGMGGRPLDILRHDSTLQFFFVPKVLIEPAHLNSFIVLCNGAESDFMACACTSPPVWLGTTELTNLQVNLTPGQGRRLFRAEGCFGKACCATDLCFKEVHVDARAGYVMAARGRGVLLVLRLVTNLPSQVKQYTGTYTVTIGSLASTLVA